jgi:hypothetical protein
LPQKSIDLSAPAGHAARLTNKGVIMKKVTTLAATFLLAASLYSVAAPKEDALMEKEKAAWQAFKDKNADAFKKVVSADVVAVYADGMADMAKELSDMQKWDLKSFEISDYKVTAQGPNVAISTYTVKIEGTFNGKDASGTYNAGSVWKKSKGEWQGIFHTNIKQAQPAG